MHNEQFGLVHDHAYWLSDLDVHDDADEGLVDAVSHGVVDREPTPTRFETAATRPTPNQRSGVRWERSVFETERENRLELDVFDVASVTI